MVLYYDLPVYRDTYKLVLDVFELAADYSIQDDGTSLCTGLVTETCYGDWYLPSAFELKLLHNAHIITPPPQKKTATHFYSLWSSTEKDSTDAWTLRPSVGCCRSSDKTLDPQHAVRAVRAF